MKLLKYLFESRFWALTVKKIQQILHNKQSIFLLIFPPIIQLIIFGLSLSPDVNQLSLGVIDYARTQESRQLVSSLTEIDAPTAKAGDSYFPDRTCSTRFSPSRVEDPSP